MAGSTFVLWALVAASAVYWGLKLTGGGGVVAAPPAVRAPAPVDPAALARLLGSSPTAPGVAPVASLASRFVLLGIVASRGRQGTALIAVDGKPGKPFAVGDAVQEGLLLQSVEGRRAALGASMDGPAAVTLELPPLHK